MLVYHGMIGAVVIDQLLPKFYTMMYLIGMAIG